MSDFHVTILGSNSAISVNNRFPSGQALTIGNDHLLIDCGEGTQFRMAQYGIKKSKIDTILITHLHGDHVFGLPGLLTSLQLSGRKAPLQVYGPAPLQAFLDTTIGKTGHFIDYPLEVIEIDLELMREEKLLKIQASQYCDIYVFELIHRIDCVGYLIKEKKRAPNIDKSFIAKYNPTIQAIKEIKSGQDYITKEGKIISHQEITTSTRAPRSYAYCSDTLFHPPLQEILKGTSTIYHEATYLENMKEQAHLRFHSTAMQAAQIAKGADSKHLILGHFSSRYSDLSPFKEEAKTIFDQVTIAKEGNRIEL